MTAPAPRPAEYLLGAFFPGTSAPHLHMTVCVMQATKWGEQTVRDAKALARWALPLRVRVGERAQFGAANQIPVRLLHVLDADKKAMLDAFYGVWFTPLPGEEARHSQNFHVTVKKLPAAEADALAGKEVELAVMFLKVVGQDAFLWRSDQPEQEERDT